MSLKNTAIKNDSKMVRISFNMKVHSFCAIGKDHFTNNLQVEFTPGELIPDYTIVEKRIKELEGQENNVEAVVAKVFDILMEVEPIYLRVESYVEDAETHFPVRVEKATNFFQLG